MDDCLWFPFAIVLSKVGCDLVSATWYSSMLEKLVELP